MSHEPRIKDVWNGPADNQFERMLNRFHAIVSVLSMVLLIALTAGLLLIIFLI